MGSTGTIIMLVLMFIAYPILISKKNKREQERQQQLINSLKKGEYILTYSGVFGKITEILEKEFGKFFVIETGEKHKSYMTVSENAVYMLTNNNPKSYNKDGEVIPTESKQENEEIKSEEKEEEKTDEK